MVANLRLSDQPGSVVLDTLQARNDVIWQGMKKGITVVQTRYYESLYKYLTRFKRQVLPYSSDVTDMKVTGFSDVVDLLGHGHGRIEINSQAFYIL